LESLISDGIEQITRQKIVNPPFRPNIGCLIGVHFYADEFENPITTQGDTPASFALG
jgi:hypothetical protein